MANIALRNPQFKSIAIASSGTLSTVCEVTIDGTLRYTLVKNAYYTNYKQLILI